MGRIRLGLLRNQLLRALKVLGEMFYGATIYEMVRDLNKERASLERLFVLIVFGDLFGVPILPPYYTLRLLPFVFPSFACWRRSFFLDRALVDLCAQEFT